MTPVGAAVRRPPGPAGPVTLGIDRPTLQILEDARREYGNVVSFAHPGGRLAYFVNEPAEIRRILVRRHGNFVKGPGFERVKMLLGNGLIVSDGAVWRRSRTMIQPAFSRACVHRLIPLMLRCSRALARRWIDAAQAGRTLNVTRETSDFALELILRAIFGPDYDVKLAAGADNPFGFLSRNAARDLRVVMKVRALRELLLRIIAERRGAGGEGDYDFLSMYLSARDKSGKGFSDDELLDELMTLIIAGYETSAGTLNWAWYLLARHPRLRAPIVAEAARMMQEAGAAGDGALGAMTATQAFLDETLRLYPPVWLFTRRACGEDVLADYELPAGTDIYLSPYLLHRTPDFWPDPDGVDPARFAAGDARRSELPYFPFSLGPRRCLGEYFSFLEMKVHLAVLATALELTPIDDAAPRLDLGINLRSKSDIFLRPRLADDSP